MTAEALHRHLATGCTTVCRAWTVTRRDGRVLGFTDHDVSLSFDGFVFTASTGLMATALEQSTGLAVDNADAVGVLSDPAISEDDIRLGLFDGAEVQIWRVNWAVPDEREVLFRGSIGEIERSNGGFRAELRGLAETLNVRRGRQFTRSCGAALGDALCGLDLGMEEYSCEVVISETRGQTRFLVPHQGAFADGWFAGGRMSMTGGSAQGVDAMIKRDTVVADGREIELWEPIADSLVPGDAVRLTTGCDKRFETCRLKFGNALNFRGFPDIPGEDWLFAYPTSRGRNTGGSRRS